MGKYAYGKFKVSDKVQPSEIREKFEILLADEEEIILSYHSSRSIVAFTNYKIIGYTNVLNNGLVEEYSIYPYSKISFYSVNFDSITDLKIWLSGTLHFDIEFAKKLNIKEVCSLIASKISY